MKYWSSFYSLVVIKNRNSINSLVAVAKKRKMTNIPGTKLNMDDTIDYAVKEFTSLANDEIQVAIMDVKEKVIMSNFLRKLTSTLLSTYLTNLMLKIFAQHSLL